MFYFDRTIILLIPAMILAFYAQFRVSSAYQRYSRMAVGMGITGQDAARRILDQNGLQGVPIELVKGTMTDHYDPRKRVMRLSQGVSQSASIAAVSIAAHEAGHAIQHSTGYAALKARNAFAPVASFASQLSWPLLLIGLLISAAAGPSGQWGYLLFDIGILLYAAAVLFQIITLPVEFNASRRAMAQLSDLGIVNQEESRGAKKMLSAAALTYVAAMAVAIANLLRLLLIRNRN